MNVPLTPDGGLTFADGISAPGKYVELRADRDTLVLISQLPAAQQPVQRLRPDARAARRAASDPAPRDRGRLARARSTTVQDWPGRLGYWEVGVPPSGPMDDRSFRLGNLLVGNAEGAAGPRGRR